MTSPSRAALCAAALLCLAALLTACLPADVSPTASPEPSTSASEEPTEPEAASGSQPTPRTAAGCADLATPSSFSSLFADAVEPAPPTRTAEYIGAAIANQWYLRQAGGLACTWSTPDTIATSEGYYGQYVELSLLPASSSDWAPFSDAEAGGAGRLFECSEYGYGCHLDQFLPAGWWLQVRTEGLTSADPAVNSTLVEPVFAALVAAASALPAPETPWSPPVTAVALPEIVAIGDCENLITSAEIQAAVGESGSISSGWNLYPNQANAAQTQLGTRECRWIKDGFSDVAYIELLPGGAWAQAQAKAAMVARGAAVDSPTIGTLPAGSTAFYEHVDSVALDLVIGGNWIKVEVANGSSTGSLSPHDASIAIGNALAARWG